VKLAVLIPVYNEVRLIGRLLDRLLATPPPEFVVPTDERRPHAGRVPMTRSIFIVDDGSTDGTDRVLAARHHPSSTPDHARVHVLRHERNRGKGAAVRTALEAALKDTPPPDVVLIQDGDLEYDPADHARLVEPILDGRADAVVGTRFGGEAHRVLYYWHYRANRFLTFASNLLTNLNMSDIECCLKAFSGEVAAQLRLREDRFGIEPELVARLSRARVRTPDAGTQRARIYEVAVSYAGRTYAEGKKIRWRDGVAALWCIARYNLWSR
jgi:glycosyltransferase involved in cell wall biosynthesis